MEWREWLETIYPRYVFAPFAERHIEFWEWVERIRQGVKIPALVAIWARGGAKSSSAELAVARLGARRAVNYVWYCCETQDQADKHVETISALLENERLAQFHPMLAERALSKYGSSKGWRHNRLHTASGLTVDSIGLDTAVRGSKTEQNRPDLIILDDVDNKLDSLDRVKRKINVLTTNILPAGSTNCNYLFIQNLVHKNSIASRLIENKADFLRDRVVSGKYPAVKDLSYVLGDDDLYHITGGIATWEGQDLAVCERQINDWGLTSFLQEAQHEVSEQLGGIWNHVVFKHVDNAPPLVKGGVWVDPAVTSTDGSSCQGIQAAGLGVDGLKYMLYSYEQITTPEDALKRAILKAVELGLERVGIEVDQGGDLWDTVYNTVWSSLLVDPDYPMVNKLTVKPELVMRRAGAIGSKVYRNQMMLVDYDKARVRHVKGTHDILEQSLRRFPIKPLDLADVAFWAWYDLEGVTVDWNQVDGLGQVEGYMESSLWR